MSGPEHYREAERIEAAAKSKDRAGAEGFSGWSRTELAALAQVHATLALAAATVDAARTRTWPGADTDPTDSYPHNDEAWQAVAS